MICHDLIPEEKFALGARCTIRGKVNESGQVVTVSFIRDHPRYPVVDDTNVSWTKNGMLYECFEDNHFLKDILCGKAPRIIPI
jgi:hypothetical protein